MDIGDLIKGLKELNKKEVKNLIDDDLKAFSDQCNHWHVQALFELRSRKIQAGAPSDEDINQLPYEERMAYKMRDPLSISGTFSTALAATIAAENGGNSRGKQLKEQGKNTADWVIAEAVKRIRKNGGKRPRALKKLISKAFDENPQAPSVTVEHIDRILRDQHDEIWKKIQSRH